jgi:hypothetical protein
MHTITIGEIVRDAGALSAHQVVVAMEELSAR